MNGDDEHLRGTNLVDSPRKASSRDECLLYRKGEQVEALKSSRLVELLVGDIRHLDFTNDRPLPGSTTGRSGLLLPNQRDPRPVRPSASLSAQRRRLRRRRRPSCTAPTGETDLDELEATFGFTFDGYGDPTHVGCDLDSDRRLLCPP